MAPMDLERAHAPPRRSLSSGDAEAVGEDRVHTDFTAGTSGAPDAAGAARARAPAAAVRESEQKVPSSSSSSRRSTSAASSASASSEASTCAESGRPGNSGSNVGAASCAAAVSGGGAGGADEGQLVVFFDWDDTLLCTTFLDLYAGATLEPKQPRPADVADGDAESSEIGAAAEPPCLGSLPPDVQRQLADIQSAARALLLEAQRIGHVYIVTNSMEGWVQYSAARWLPELVPLLHRATIIPLRAEKGGPRFEGEVGTWKAQAFVEVVQRLDGRRLRSGRFGGSTSSDDDDFEEEAGSGAPEAGARGGVAQVLAIGDSELEMDAAHAAGEALGKQAFVKTVKMRQAPTAEDLSKQLRVVLGSLGRIASKPHDLSISLERKCAAAPAPCR